MAIASQGSENHEEKIDGSHGLGKPKFPLDWTCEKGLIWSMRIQITLEDRSYSGWVGDQEGDQGEADNRMDCYSSFP